MQSWRNRQGQVSLRSSAPEAAAAKGKKERERKRKSKKEKAGIEEPEGPVHEHHWNGTPEKNLSC